MYRAERIRIRRRALTLIGIFLSPGSHALGVGELRLQSALNQTLKAEVPLVVSDEKLDDIRVALAPPETFAQAGIERQQFLAGFRFHPERRADGSHVIRISSRDPIREPFLSFLMEVSWPDGRVVKEFTVLVDPPAQVLPALGPAGQAEPSSRYPRAATPRSPYLADHPSSPLALSEVEGYEGRPRPAQDVSEYGPVRRRDTLSSIARAVNTDGDLTPEQIKVGIYRANPDAFIGGDIDALRRGAILHIPPHAVLAERQPVEAAREWRELRAAARRGSPEAAAAAYDRPPATPVPVPPPGGGEAPAQGSRLKLLAPGNKGQAGRTGGKEDIALEVAESLRQENEEIRARLGALEQQLSTLQKLLELKEQQMAAMQPAAPAAGTAPAGALPTPASPAASALPSPEPSPAAETAAGAPVTVAIQAPAEAAARPEAEPANGSWLWGVGFGAITLAAALAWWANRKRRLFTLNLGLPSSLDMLMAGKKESAGARTVPSAGARSLESYRNAATAVDSGEPVDPIAEADAFLANGKQAQAEQLMRAAVAAHPERDEFHLKLLEILYLGGKYQAFAELAEDVSGWRETRPELWGEVSRMSLKMRLKSPGPADAPGNFPDAGFAASSPAHGAVDHCGSGSAATIPVPPVPDEATSTEAAMQSESVAVAGDMAPLEFDLSGLGSVAVGEGVKNEPETVQEAGNLIAYEPAPYAAETAVPSAETLESLLAELEGLGDRTEKAQAPLPANKTAEFASELPMTIEIEAVPVAPNAGGIAEPGFGEPRRALEDADPYAEITGMDPLETKLDLSKAYVDMGDAGSARELLEEVLAVGSDRQKAEALILMDRLTALPGW
ncbi:MAG: FimV/HubP family polar landmark protein [Pseudomonadota bacterium]